MKFVNQQKFDLAALTQARKGIVDPHRAYLMPGTLICRFADSEQLAGEGAWWFEAARLSEIRRWATLNRIAVPHAARALGAVAHSYGAMQVLVSTMITAPLLVYRGKSRTRFNIKQGRLSQLLSPVSLREGAQIEQLYIPGLRDCTIREACSMQVSVEHFGQSPSHARTRPALQTAACH